MMKKLLINASIFFVSIIIALYLVEGYFFFKRYFSIQKLLELEQEKFLIYKKKTNKDYDKRNRYQIYQDLKKENPEIVVSIYPTYFINNNLEYLPLSGISDRQTIFCNENGYYPIYLSDRYGFNNLDEEWNKEEIEFLITGDSYAQGSCVAQTNTIAGNLKKLIPNSNDRGILSLGMGGSGPLTEFATLREYFPQKKVKRVLFLYYKNDLSDLNKELKNKILLNYLNDKNFTQNLIMNKEKVEELLLKKLIELEKSEGQKMLEGDRLKLKKDRIFSQFIRLHSIRKTVKKTILDVPSYNIDEFKNILVETNKFTKKNNSKLYFVYLPCFPCRNSPQLLNRSKKIINLVKDLNIPIVNAEEILFKKLKDPLSLIPFKQDGHFTENGYQLLTEAIYYKVLEIENLK